MDSSWAVVVGVIATFIGSAVLPMIREWWVRKHEARESRSRARGGAATEAALTIHEYASHRATGGDTVKLIDAKDEALIKLALLAEPGEETFFEHMLSLLGNPPIDGKAETKALGEWARSVTAYHPPSTR